MNECGKQLNHKPITSKDLVTWLIAAKNKPSQQQDSDSEEEDMQHHNQDKSASQSDTESSSDGEVITIQRTPKSDSDLDADEPTIRRSKRHNAGKHSNKHHLPKSVKKQETCVQEVLQSYLDVQNCICMSYSIILYSNFIIMFV